MCVCVCVCVCILRNKSCFFNPIIPKVFFIGGKTINSYLAGYLEYIDKIIADNIFL